MSTDRNDNKTRCGKPKAKGSKRSTKDLLPTDVQHNDTDSPRARKRVTFVLLVAIFTVFAYNACYSIQRRLNELIKDVKKEKRPLDKHLVEEKRMMDERQQVMAQEVSEEKRRLDEDLNAQKQSVDDEKHRMNRKVKEKQKLAEKANAAKQRLAELQDAEDRKSPEEEAQHKPDTEPPPPQPPQNIDHDIADSVSTQQEREPTEVRTPHKHSVPRVVGNVADHGENPNHAHITGRHQNQQSQRHPSLQHTEPQIDSRALPGFDKTYCVAPLGPSPSMVRVHQDQAAIPSAPPPPISPEYLLQSQDATESDECSCSCIQLLLCFSIIFIILTPFLLAIPLTNLHGNNFCDTDSRVIRATNNRKCIPCPSSALYCINGKARCKDKSYWIDPDLKECVKYDYQDHVIENYKTMGKESLQFVRSVVQEIRGWDCIKQTKSWWHDTKKLSWKQFCKMYEMELMTAFLVLAWHFPVFRGLVIFCWSKMMLSALDPDQDTIIVSCIKLLSYVSPIMFGYAVWKKIAGIVS